MRKPRVVVVGYGFAGRGFHCYLVKLAPGLVLHGVASRNPGTRERIEREQGVRAYAGMDEVTADRDVDLVVLATPSSTHAGLAVKAMEAGKHVVTDKVMCVSLEECDRMISAARRAGVLLTVFQNRRLDGDFLTLRKVLGDGELGELRWLEMAWQGFGPPGGWRGRADMGGGRFLDLGAHLVDQLLLLMPRSIETVWCRMHHDFPRHDVESHSMLLVTFEGGATGVVDTTSMAAVSKPRFWACGTRATFAKYGLDPQEAAMLAGDIDGAVEAEDAYATVADTQGRRRVPTVPGRWRTYYENIAEVLTRGTEPLVKLEEARRVMAVLDAGMSSARSGEVVHMTLPASSQGAARER